MPGIIPGEKIDRNDLDRIRRSEKESIEARDRRILRRWIARIILECRRNVRGNSKFADGGRSGCRSRRSRPSGASGSLTCGSRACIGYWPRWIASAPVDSIEVVVGHIQREPTPIDEEIGLSLYSLRSLRGTSYS
jgi:hypothetical protein